MADFSQYKTISSKLKKRFLLRKPNLNEASEQFSALSRELKEFKSYSGYCHLAVARCEHSLGNASSEFNALMEAARLFRDGSELNAAISAYRHAILVCEAALLPSVYLELGKMYESEGRFPEAAETYKEGKLCKEAAHCYIDLENFESALNCFDKCADSLTEDDTITVFMVKLCFFDPRRYQFSLPVLPEESQNDEIITLNCLLESLLLLVKEGEDDHRVVSQLFASLYPQLNKRQKGLLHYITSKI